jgi:hypothetical protein
VECRLTSRINRAISTEFRRPTTYYTEIPSGINNVFKYGHADAARLKDIRKRLDSVATSEEADEVTRSASYSS